MTPEPAFKLVDPALARARAGQLYEVMHRSLAEILPPTADVRHIGATAIPGCLTKGDLDIVIRVPAADFSSADAALAARFARNEGSIRTPTFSAFEDLSRDPHVGLQLAAIDSRDDVFHLFVEALRGSLPLVNEYNGLKRRHDGADMGLYRAAKDAFVERVLGELSRRQ